MTKIHAGNLNILRTLLTTLKDQLLVLGFSLESGSLKKAHEEYREPEFGLVLSKAHKDYRKPEFGLEVFKVGSNIEAGQRELGTEKRVRNK